MADTPNHTPAARILIARLDATLRADRFTGEEKVTELRAIVGDHPDRAHLLAHATGPGDGPRADTILRAAGADMDEVARLRAMPVGRSLLAGIAEGLTASDGGTGPR